MIRIDNVKFQIGSKRILEGVSAKLEAGKINLILGANGAGKSTLVKLIAKQLKPNSGDILYCGQNLRNFSISDLAKVRAVLSQSVDLAFPMLVHEVVMLGRYAHFSGRPNIADQQACEEAIELFGLTDFCERDYMSLSGGEKQRVHFARVFAQIHSTDNSELKYLILDEPLNSLDIFYQYDFMEKVKNLCEYRNLLVVGVVHDLNLAAKYADHIILLSDGNVLKAGKPTEVLTERNIKAAFNMEVEIKIESSGVQLRF